MIGFYNASVILTYLGVVSAVFGMSQAFNGNFKIAILCLMISGLTDMYDGTIAKMIKRSEDAKKFGIEIDSLCDLVCFGVYPVVIGYCLGMDQWYARILDSLVLNLMKQHLRRLVVLKELFLHLIQRLSFA